jgi:hypothetical protein
MNILVYGYEKSLSPHARIHHEQFLAIGLAFWIYVPIVTFTHEAVAAHRNACQLTREQQETVVKEAMLASAVGQVG